MELENTWKLGSPVMSTLVLATLLALKGDGKLQLIQQVIANNPGQLPSSVQWVNVERIRVKDAFTHLWWLASPDRPYADNR